MDTAGDHILATAGFTLHQNGQLAAGGPDDLGPEAGHDLGVADQGSGQLFAPGANGFGVVQMIQ